MADLVTALTSTIDSASKVANTPFITTVIDRVTGFKLSEWAAEGEVRKKIIHDEYEKAKKNGISGVQMIANLRNTINLIDTAVKSSKYIDSNKTNDIKMDNDFFWNTIEHSKTISNDEMQELVAKIIAGEYNNPGTYAMSTLQAIKMLGKEELELFEKMGSLLVNKDMIPSNLFAMPENAKTFMKQLGIDFGSLQMLQGLGLFLPNAMAQTINHCGQRLRISYFTKEIIFIREDVNHRSADLPGFYSLSRTGKQIISHLEPQFNNEYFDWLKENYKIPNYKQIGI